MKLILQPTSDEISVRAVAMVKRWELSADLPGSAEHLRQLIWYADESDSTVTFVAHAVLDLNYLWLQGTEQDQHGLELALRGALEFYTLADILTVDWISLDQSTAAQMTRGIALMAADSFEDEVFAFVRRALFHDSATVRRSAYLAISVLSWRAFRDVLVDLTSGAWSEEVRKALHIMDSHGWR